MRAVGLGVVGGVRLCFRVGVGVGVKVVERCIISVIVSCLLPLYILEKQQTNTAATRYDKY